eukprot:3493877-Alexandrium_andersonii.AAC.1
MSADSSGTGPRRSCHPAYSRPSGAPASVQHLLGRPAVHGVHHPIAYHSWHRLVRPLPSDRSGQAVRWG